MVVNLGTSAVNMLIEKAEHLSGGFSYLAGQAEDSIVPGYVGIETSQAAFGDTYAWLKRLLLWPLAHLPLSWSEEARQEVLAQADAAMLPALQAAAQALPPCSSPVALDWLNGRRYPYNRDDAVSTITGLNLSTDAPMLYQSLVEATAFGQKQIISQLLEHGVTIQNIIAVGGIAQKSDYVMQVLSGRPAISHSGLPHHPSMRLWRGHLCRRGSWALLHHRGRPENHLPSLPARLPPQRCISRNLQRTV